MIPTGKYDRAIRATTSVSDTWRDPYYAVHSVQIIDRPVSLDSFILSLLDVIEQIQVRAVQLSKIT